MVRAGMKPSAPVSSSLTNRPARVTPEMRPSKRRADAVGEVMRDQPVVGLALGLHGAALGRRNLRGDLGQRRGVLALGQAVGAEVSARGSRPRCTIRSA